MSDESDRGATIYTIRAPAAAAGERLDRFLAAQLPALSRSRLKTLIEKGHASRDGVPCTAASEAVRVGAIYRLLLPPPLPATPRPQAMALSILYEDAHLLVLDKPAGLVVHPAPGNEEGTLVNAILAHCGASLPGIGGEKRPGIVHRLDKDTSGVMVVAKSEAALAALSAAFAERDLERTYLALCWGVPEPAAGTIEGAIGRDPRERKRMAVVTRGGKPALTRYRTLGHYELAVALLELHLATGRTHQIRVHLASCGHPLVGDPLYLRRIPSPARSLPENLRHVLLDFPRQALHATSLGFRHPTTGAWLQFHSAPPADLATLLAQLGLADLTQT